MVPILSREGMVWDGQAAFTVINERTVIDAGLHGNIAAIVDAVRIGKLGPSRIYKSHNQVTNYARSALVQVMTGGGISSLPAQMELGTGTGTTTPSDTDLWAPAPATLKPLSQTNIYLQYYAQYICAWQSTDPIVGTWQEAGLKDAAGNLWAHVATTITVNQGEMLVGQWQVQILGD